MRENWSIDLVSMSLLERVSCESGDNLNTEKSVADNSKCYASLLPITTAAVLYILWRWMEPSQPEIF